MMDTETVGEADATYYIIGLDLSTEHKKKGFCVISYNSKMDKGNVKFAGNYGENNGRFDDYLKKEKIILAVDVPFGWPREFPCKIKRISANKTTDDPILDKSEKECYFKRECERKVKAVEFGNTTGLEVAANRIARTAFHWVYEFRPKIDSKKKYKALFGFKGEDKLLTNPKYTHFFLETYPGAFMSCFDSDKKKTYKPGEKSNNKQKKEAIKVRKQIFCDIRKAYDVSASQPQIIAMTKTDDNFDGFISAICGLDYLRWALKDPEITLFRPDPQSNRVSIQKEGWFVFRYVTFKEKIKKAFDDLNKNTFGSEWILITLENHSDMVNANKFTIKRESQAEEPSQLGDKKESITISFSWEEHAEGWKIKVHSQKNCKNIDDEDFIKCKEGVSEKRLKEIIEKHIYLTDLPIYWDKHKENLKNDTCSFFGFGEKAPDEYIINNEKTEYTCQIKKGDNLIEIKIPLEEIADPEKRKKKVRKLWKDKLLDKIKEKCKSYKGKFKIDLKSNGQDVFCDLINKNEDELINKYKEKEKKRKNR